MKKLRMVSLCSGIGGADLAAEWTGAIEIVGQVEINTFCQAVLSKHWPSVLRFSDIKEIRGDEFGAIDIIVGGIPCQPFSRAGKQRGQEDDRYLWPEMFRIVQRCRPSWVVVENVANFTNMALDDVSVDLGSAGYAVQAFVLPACAIGAPHIRERCFVVAHCDSEQSQRRRIPGKLGRAQTGGQDPEEERQRLRYAAFDCGQDVAHSSSAGWEEWNPAAVASEQGYPARRTSAPGRVAFSTDRRECPPQREGESGTHPLPFQSGTGATQSRMGRVFDGVFARLDGYRWPALPGQKQYPGEPPRVVTERVSNRAKRLQALGNAIVPSQIYPFFVGIVEWERMDGGQEG